MGFGWDSAYIKLNMQRRMRLPNATQQWKREPKFLLAPCFFEEPCSNLCYRSFYIHFHSCRTSFTDPASSQGIVSSLQRDFHTCPLWDNSVSALLVKFPYLLITFSRMSISFGGRGSDCIPFSRILLVLSPGATISPLQSSYSLGINSMIPHSSNRPNRVWYLSGTGPQGRQR